MQESQEKEFSIQQYRECYESLRQHDRLIWQTPTIAVAIAGGLGVAAFEYVTDPCAQGCLFMFGAILTACLLYAVIKHRYFSGIEQETLCKIEKTMGTKLIMRTTKPQEKSDYWHTEKPKWFQKRSAHKVLIGGMILLFVIFLALTIWAFAFQKIPPWS